MDGVGPDGWKREGAEIREKVHGDQMTTRGDANSYEYPKLRPLDAFPALVSGQEVLCLRDPLRYSEAVVYVPAQTATILGLFDG